MQAWKNTEIRFLLVPLSPQFEFWFTSFDGAGVAILLDPSNPLFFQKILIQQYSHFKMKMKITLKDSDCGGVLDTNAHITFSAYSITSLISAQQCQLERNAGGLMGDSLSNF